MAKKSHKKQPERGASGGERKVNTKARPKPKSRSIVAISSPDKAEKPSSSEKKTLMLDFTNCDDLFQDLRKAAQRDFRAIEMEIFWAVKEFLKTNNSEGENE
jgi:hypothetical protein